MNYQYHDTKYAEFILKNGFTTQFFLSELKLLALYYRDILGYKPKKREEELYKFCEKNIAKYNKVLFFRTIDKALNYARKKTSKLIDIDFIPIYKSEIEYIKNLDIEYNLQKIIFTILVYIKLNKKVREIKMGDVSNEYFLPKNKTDKDIFKLTNISNIKNYSHLFYLLEQMEYITTYYSGATRINILYDMPIDEIDIAVEVKDYSNIGYYYDYYNKANKVKLCTKCGMPFKATGKNSKYCKEHQGYQEKKERIIVCIDCGKSFVVNSNNKRSVRCIECYKIYRRKRKMESVKSKKT